MMIIQVFPSGPFKTNAYVIACSDTKKTAIIDPAPQSTLTIIPFIEKQGLHVQKILLTHSHWDHIADAADMKATYQVPVLVHPKDAKNLQEPGSDGIPLFISIEPVEPGGFFGEGDIISVGNLKLEALETPGHTPGGVCFYIKEHGALISGDTLFCGTMGRLSIPTGEPDAMWKSLIKLSHLPAITKVYPGHGDPTTIGAEHWLQDAQKRFGNSD